jgi:hypothetical protein
MAIAKNRKSPNASGFYMVSSTAVAGKEEIELSFSALLAGHCPKVWTVEIDNSLNAYPVYLKMWWLPEVAVTIGSSEVEFQLVAPASTKQTYSFTTGPTMKNALTSTKITWVCSDAPGTPGGNTPVADVPVRLLYSQD